MWTTLTKIYNRLQDDESRFIFRKRLEYNLCNENPAPLREIVNQYKDEDEQTILTLIQNKEAFMFKDIIVFGAGRWGRFYLDLLKKYQIGHRIAAFCDNHICGTMEGLEILSVPEAVNSFPDAVYITASPGCCIEMKNQLISMGIPAKNIFLYLHTSRVFGQQYFDKKIIHPQKNGVFIDGGSLNLYDSEKYMAYNPDFKKIYAFEPDSENYKNCLKKRKNIGLSDDRLEVVNKALWSRAAELRFTSDADSSQITEKGTKIVKTVALDEFLDSCEKVSYIKLDIEGAELEALCGAKEIIKREVPNLAVSIYHKNGDIMDIPEYVLGMNSGYKFYIRHYSCYRWETVLYAVCDEW